MTVEHLTQEDIAEISAEAKINLGAMIGSDTVNVVNQALDSANTSSSETKAAVLTVLQERYQDFTFSLTKY